MIVGIVTRDMRGEMGKMTTESVVDEPMFLGFPPVSKIRSACWETERESKDWEKL